MKHLQELPVNTRIIISSLWTAMLFVYAYIDIFAFFRADVLENALAGKVFIFEANQLFFIFTTIYVLIPISMIVLTLVVRANITKICNLIIAPLYILTIVGSMVGETWMYFLMGSTAEIIILCTIIYQATTWPSTKPEPITD